MLCNKECFQADRASLAANSPESGNESTVAMDVSQLSDAELRSRIKEYDPSVGPVMGTTRKLYEKKLLKYMQEDKKAAKASPAVAKRPVSKSPARTKSAASKPASAPRRRLNRSESEDERDDDDDDEPARNTSGKPLVSTPEKKSVVASPPTARSGLNESTRRTVSSRSASNTSANSTAAAAANSIIPGLRTGLPPISASPASPTRSTYKVTETSWTEGAPMVTVTRKGSSDRPGATPPRRGGGGASTAASIFDDMNFSTGSARKAPAVSARRTAAYTATGGATSSYTSAFARRDHLDLGNTTGEESSDDHEESSRVIVRESTKSPLRKAWDRLIGKGGDRKKAEAELKYGGEPATLYDLRMGATRTRWERDPKTGRVKVDQPRGSSPSSTRRSSTDISALLLVILSVFFAILAVAYLSTANREAVVNTAHVVTGAARDTMRAFYTYAILPVLLIVGAALVLAAGYFAHKKWQAWKEEEETAMFDLIDKILDMVKESADDGQEYLAVPHVRDIIYPPAKRRGAELARWERAVQFIDANESRVATETRVLQGGQECAVWKWLSAKKGGWQGNAFPSSPESQKERQPLTRCLKIREMFRPDSVNVSQVERDVAEKLSLAGVEAVHSYVDEETADGVVYVKANTLADALTIFKQFHGFWYNGRLVTVKYVREERYSQRFPSVPLR